MEYNHDKILKQFKRIIDERSLDSMNKQLYSFFHLYCGFIAHYNIHGFKDEYAGKRFILFLENFINMPFYIFKHGAHGKLIQEMSEYAKANESMILYEWKNRLDNDKLQKLRKLAEELGYEVVKKGSTHPIEPLSINPDGQTSFL